MLVFLKKAKCYRIYSQVPVLYLCMPTYPAEFSGSTSTNLGKMALMVNSRAYFLGSIGLSLFYCIQWGLILVESIE